MKLAPEKQRTKIHYFYSILLADRKPPVGSNSSETKPSYIRNYEGLLPEEVKFEINFNLSIFSTARGSSQCAFGDFMGNVLYKIHNYITKCTVDSV